MSALVSILIPCYNAESWIGDTLESALSQTWENKEIVVVDDGSKDGSAGVVERFQQRGVRLIRSANGGAAAARNRAFRESAGEYIQFLDADDLLAPDKIELQMCRLQREPEGRVASCSWGRFYDVPEKAAFRPSAAWADLAPVEFLRLLYRDHLMMHPGAWLVPRAVADSAGLWDERLSLDDDGEYFCRIVLSSTGVCFVGDAKSYYRSGTESSLSQSKSEKAWKSQFLSTALCSEHLLGRDEGAESRQALANRFQRFVHEAYPDVPQLRREAESRVKELGGSPIRFDAGPALEPVRRLLGWKAAARLRRVAYRLGYARRGHQRRRQREIRADRGDGYVA